MFKLFAPLSAVVVAISLAGCGGLSSVIPNTLAGTYSGSFTTGGASTGSMNLNIGNDGTLTGNITDTSGQQTGTITGSVSVLGVFSGTVHLTSTTETLTGTLTQSTSGGSVTTGLSGTLIVTGGPATGDTDTVSLSATS